MSRPRLAPRSALVAVCRNWLQLSNIFFVPRFCLHFFSVYRSHEELFPPAWHPWLVVTALRSFQATSVLQYFLWSILDAFRMTGCAIGLLSPCHRSMLFVCHDHFCAPLSHTCCSCLRVHRECFLRIWYFRVKIYANYIKAVIHSDVLICITYYYLSWNKALRMLIWPTVYIYTHMYIYTHLYIYTYICIYV